MAKIMVVFRDEVMIEYDNIKDAQDAIEEASLEGVGVEYIEDTDGNPYSLIWSVLLQKES